jgi:hypothetical protein
MLNVASAKYVNVMCMMICAKLLIEIETLILHNGWNIKKQQPLSPFVLLKGILL